MAFNEALRTHNESNPWNCPHCAQRRMKMPSVAVRDVSEMLRR
jgi:hypothetical protein